MAINTLYLDNAILRKAKEVFNSQHPKNIRLESFFQKSVFLLLQKKLQNADYILKFDAEKYRYFAASLKEIDSLIYGDYFKFIIEKILGLKKYKLSYEIKKFCPANYTLLHDSEKEKHGIDFVLDFSKTTKAFGGHIKYLTEREELLQLNPCPNSLSFVERQQGVMRYIKYVQHRQKWPIVYVSGTIFK